ncbi:nucleotidyltransferase family protein [Niabella beijingensis]|uniref:nucleotidyltransferase family protein n=1 Tax=Niabella beijingensis TaxID=2872700 RepID=UPI001CBC029D|nr:nucleotidyltransferase family protein [Niabella beijingensis]MBZ4187282.1 nucleotidyltransferase family protein [Niabella beijingensis]
MKFVLSDLVDNLSVEQTLLLRACLAKSKTEREGYVRAWENEVQIMDLDFSSSRLVPYLLYKNQQEGISCRHDKRLKILYKYWWLRTQHISNQLRQVHRAFLAEGIAVVVIKGASIRQYYPRAELRSMSDFDLLIPQQKMQEAIGILRRMEFVPHQILMACIQEVPGLLFDFGHAVSCTNPSSDTFIDLHWKIGSNCTKQFTERLWLHLVPCPELPGGKKPALAYEVFMILIHAGDKANRHNLNWIIDIAQLHDQLDAPLWQQARQLAIEEKKEDLFDYACRVLLQFGLPVPDPGKVKTPPRLIYKEARKGGIHRVLNGPRTVRNLICIITRLYPHASLWQQCYQFVRSVRFVFISRRIEKRIDGTDGQVVQLRK